MAYNQHDYEFESNREMTPEETMLVEKAKALLRLADESAKIDHPKQRTFTNLSYKVFRPFTLEYRTKSSNFAFDKYGNCYYPEYYRILSYQSAKKLYLGVQKYINRKVLNDSERYTSSNGD